MVRSEFRKEFLAWISSFRKETTLLRLEFLVDEGSSMVRRRADGFEREGVRVRLLFFGMITRPHLMTLRYFD